MGNDFVTYSTALKLTYPLNSSKISMLLVTSRRSKISRSFAKVKLGFAHLLDCLSIPNEQVNILSSIETFGVSIKFLMISSVRFDYWGTPISDVEFLRFGVFSSFHLYLRGRIEIYFDNPVLVIVNCWWTIVSFAVAFGSGTRFENGWW